MILHDVQQGSPEWHALRIGRLTSTRAAGVLGWGYDSPLKTWRTMQGLDQEVIPNEAMTHGTVNEDVAALEIEMRTGIQYERVGFAIASPRTWLCASPDRRAPDGNLLEIKCPYRRGLPPTVDDVNVGYIIQVCQAMLCTDAPGADLMFYSAAGVPDEHGGNPTDEAHAVVYNVRRCPKFERDLTEALQLWYVAHVVHGIEPVPRQPKVPLGGAAHALLTEKLRW